MIDVYAKRPRRYENVNYHIVYTFDGIDVVNFDGLRCTFVSQTFNNMLADFDNIDEHPLVEGLSRYYYEHGKSFNRLLIKPENMLRFNSIKDWAIEYYDEG